MTPQELKNSILQLAIQGKLVEQRAEEGTAEALYAEIQKEKQKLIKEGKIKKEKPLPEITDDEKPFDIPENWMWVRLQEIFELINGDRGENYPSKDKLSTFGDIPFISAINMEKYTVKEDGLLFVSQQQYELLRSGKLMKNDFVFCLRGSLGKFCKYPFEKGAIASSLVILRKYYDIEDEYLKVYLGSPLLYKQIHESDNGTAQPNLGARDIAQYLIPLPPLAEQKRIVAKIEELLPLIDRYEQAWIKLEDFNKRFPTDMQKSILQTAIEGKLVEQRPEEGTGEDLYRQIQAEKQKLIKEGKIKKDKPLPEITDDEKPFDIPNSWKWCYIGDVFQHNTGKALNGSDKAGSPLEYITTSNVYWNYFELGKLKTMLFTDDEVEKCTVQKGDLLVLEGGDCGRAAIWNYDYQMRIQNHIHRLRPYIEVCIEYFYHIFYLYKNTGMINGKGIAIQGLSANALHSLIVPLPPLAEQKRIVEKLNQLLPLCEKLK